MADTIRCLLASPTPGADGESGDAQYTRDLLARPPANVEYVRTCKRWPAVSSSTDRQYERALLS